MEEGGGIDEFEDFDLDNEGEREILIAKIDKLEARCKSGNIEFKRGADEDGDPFARVFLKSGRDAREIYVYSSDRADILLEIEFEKLAFVPGYDAVCSYSDGFVEAGLRSTSLSTSSLMRRITRLSEVTGESITLKHPVEAEGFPDVILGPPSKDFRALSQSPTPFPSIRLNRMRSKQSDHVLEELRGFSDSVMLQIDGLFGATFILRRERRPIPGRVMRRPREGVSLQYPLAKYNASPVSLYWYAKSARDMPLLRFLAFYQSVEFYFPRYSQAEARKRVGSVIKNPTFRAFSDDDLDRVIAAIRLSRKGGLGDEKAQLRAVIQECVGADEIRDYITAVPERVDHLSGKSRRQKYHKVPVENKNADLRNDVADRIYDIRCRIVHTKDMDIDDGISMLLPFSEDADYLAIDIDIMEFVARAVLVASSGELS